MGARADSAMRTIALLALASCCNITSGPALAASTTAAPSLSASLYNISLGLIWDSVEADTQLRQQFSQILLPSIKSACPDSRRLEETRFSVATYTFDSLISLDNLALVMDGLASFNYLYLGVKKNSLTSLLENFAPATTVPGYPRMQVHTIAPMPQNYLEDALLKVIGELIDEGLYPNSTLNRVAAFIVDESVELAKMDRILDFFNRGVIFFHFNQEQLESYLLQIKNQGIINIIVVLDSALGDFVKQAAFNLNMFAYKYRWIFHGLRLINAEFDPRMMTYSTNITSIEFGRVQDALRLNLRTGTSVLVNDLISIWGIYLKNYLCNETIPVTTIYNGLTGQFSLDADGSVTRASWNMQIYRGLEGRKQHIGKWSSDGSFEMLRMPDQTRTPNASLQELGYNPFRIVTFISPPFVMYKSGVPKSAPLRDQLIGMYPEICKILLARLGISNYEFFLQPDGASGKQLENGTWNGMMGTVSNGMAHLGCAPITVQGARKGAVRFSQVIHTAPLSILYKLPAATVSSAMFHFLQPLDGTIWLGFLALLLCSAAVLSALHRLDPDMGVNLGPYNSIYFSFAEAVQGTTGLVPKSVPSRIVVCTFWFFTLFLLLTYIANSAAFRLLEAVDKQPDSLEALVQNDRFEFCVVRNGAIMAMLNQSVNGYAQFAYALMTERFSNGVVDSATTALDIILNSSTPFALIADSLQNAYLRNTNCGLTSAGAFYWLKTALIMPPDSEYASFFDNEIVRIAEQIGSLQKQVLNSAAVDKASCSADHGMLASLQSLLPPEPWPVIDDSLGLADILGISVINILGCCLALAISGIEFCWGRLLQRRSNKRRAEQTARASVMSQRQVRKRE